jgi:hypothetical protein
MLYIFLVVETFPQHIQATCFGIVEFEGMVGKFIGPFMITFADAMHISPILLAGIIMMTLQVIPLIPIKETLLRKKEGADEKEGSLLEAEV